MESEAVRLLLLRKFKHPERTGKRVDGLPSQRWWKVNEESNCWEWVAGTSKNGYPVISYKNRTATGHRVVYEIAKGTIPNGLCLDHLCRNKKCVNPDHLEAVTQRENILRGSGAAALNSKKTHCHRGHRLLLDNLGINADGGRRCKKCGQISWKKRKIKIIKKFGSRWEYQKFLRRRTKRRIKCQNWTCDRF